ncbi:hypothetical protein GGD52_005035 [Agrobacterium tumefaciens]|nr:hypothetical protein [Agrobacterium radiobacter]MBB5590402.1 hypothetical protein [Agrobacterium radiobacter]
MSGFHSVKSQLVLNVGIGSCVPPQPNDLYDPKRLYRVHF